jgi:hypothetical protein
MTLKKGNDTLKPAKVIPRRVNPYIPQKDLVVRLIILYILEALVTAV